ncbi:uncharacterized protein DUF4157 [Chitinophaga niastensis]|uniref:Uncharacterized protein DUF4157 n=1 Tax=Chitinophaga niastensis TaxID=536980 RepID=A0A2P8HF29_CHINA|nr:DUF4157 domain-containing protein [Chitinophaga niastensis]PSL44804.1 uncharacterized protein DUF4157 [Chitinophaga niastensis]
MSEHNIIAPATQAISPAAQPVTVTATEIQPPAFYMEGLQRLPIQYKLSVGAVDDPMEAEADSMADQVMRMPETSFIQRKCAHCEEEEKVHLKPLTTFIQRKSDSSNQTVSNSVSDSIAATRGGGNAMPATTQSFMENRFGTAFSDVRIHTGDYAVQLSRDLQAQAFTVGNDIYFNSGKFSPESDSGKHLLAHELTHTMQQSGRSQPKLKRENYTSLRTAGPVIQRTPADQDFGTPQHTGPENARMVTLPHVFNGPAEVIPHVTRTLIACPCRRVPDPRTGLFWDPDLNNFALAFSYCTGQTRADIYAQLQSNLTSILTSGANPVGTLRAGVDITTGGTTGPGAQITAEGVGTNEGAGTAGRPGAIPEGTPGAGGRVRVQVQGRDGQQWSFFVEGEYIRRLGSLPTGVDPNQGSGGLGFRYRDFTITVTGSGGAGETRGMATFGGTFGSVTPPVCYNCVCPQPHPHYECIDFELDRNEPVTENVTTHPADDFRVYYRYVQTDPSEDPQLRTESDRNLSEVASQVAGGGVVELIRGYASPEGDESRLNQDLSERRANKTLDLIRGRVGANVTLPIPYGGGELLGARPTPAPSSRLGDIITPMGFRSAEDLTVLLTGAEIPNDELSDQFISLFNRVTVPDDRLALFGLTADNPIAPQVLVAVDAFLASRGRGRRPWEHIFRLLRVGIIRVRRTVVTPTTTIVTHRGNTTQADDTTCAARGRQAEITQSFGPIAPSSTSASDAREECRTDAPDTRTADGCNYNLQHASQGRLDPPRVGSTPFGTLP